MAPRPGSRTALLLQILDEAFDRKAWHGTTLRGAVRGVDAADAIRRPGRERHNIAELVLHAAYWKYAVRRRMTGEKRGTFARKGSNWFRVDALAPDQWRDVVRVLEEEHAALRDAVASIPDRRLDEKAPGSGTWTVRQLVSGAAAHDLYHTGQIQLVKRLL
ncbi:MAG: DinB family protein [Thermoanaerobaculia bacterium]